MPNFGIPALTLSRRTNFAARPPVLPRPRQATLRLFPGSKASASASYSTVADGAISRAPRIDRGGSKLFKSADQAVADLKAGSTILSSGFGLCGVAETLISAINRRGADNLHSLTAILNNAGIASRGLSRLIEANQVDRLVLSYLGNNKVVQQEYLSGEISIELTPQGTLAERLRAGGAGIPAFYTSTGALRKWVLGMGQYPTEEEVDPEIINAGKETITLVPGAAIFDSTESFGMIRGGHVDVSILGALQVSANGDLANYTIPGKVFKGMGGAMDLVSNPDHTKIVVTTSHTARDGSPKIVSQCGLPLTGANCVSTIITELCVFQVDRAKGELLLTELALGAEVEEVQVKTGTTFAVAEHLEIME
ncbi:3-oxoacid CoA-transferase [Aspergillus homomorphus CBS 101889]|uniref:Nagb/rpia/CoA transferase-like protein n=1 Tax=Aspergillus homomorphus (strain CBS 101889) TaxID=1450537 RepID=A0A395I5F1_ASPHC|nr:nagb/rpia/CoA transferase-like protein [Aspergillus homomorphus CBS 101889]RAL15310.1 nagb/rpia/CoA transferase-like protein [Aspergillus homomorphus CBS 101889]